MFSNELPYISVVIPVKNEEKFITRCLNSVLSQKYPKDKYEIIIVDNDSSDETINLALKFKDIKILKKSGNIGAVRNYGGKEAKGDIIAFLDGDCIPEDNWLIKASRVLLSDKNIAAVSAVLLLEDVHNSPWIEKYWINYLNSKYKDTINYTTTISSYCFIIKKDLINKIGWFNENLETCEDSDLGYRITGKGYNLIVDKRIRTIHLRNAKNSKQYFMRQLWQGGSNLKNIFYHDFKWDEIPSIVGPIIYIILLAIFVVGLLTIKYIITFITLSALLLIPIAKSYKSLSDKSIHEFFGYTYIWILYLSARGIGMIIKLRSYKK